MSVLHPFRIETAGHGPVAGVASGTSGPGVVLLHDLGEDLDAVAWLAGLPGLGGMSCLALDLPGHGLSGDNATGAPDEAIAAVLAHFACRGSGPFTVVGFGQSCSIAHAMSRCPEVAGVALVAPRTSPPLQCRATRRLALLGVISGLEPAAEQVWRAIRTAAALPWTTIRVPVPSAGLLRPDQPTARIIASHLGGFAVDMLANWRRNLVGR